MVANKPSGKLPKKIWGDIGLFSKTFRQYLLKELAAQGFTDKELEEEVLKASIHLSSQMGRGGNSKSF